MRPRRRAPHPRHPGRGCAVPATRHRPRRGNPAHTRRKLPRGSPRRTPPHHAAPRWTRPAVGGRRQQCPPRNRGPRPRSPLPKLEPSCARACWSIFRALRWSSGCFGAPWVALKYDTREKGVSINELRDKAMIASRCSAPFDARSFSTNSGGIVILKSIARQLCVLCLGRRCSRRRLVVVRWSRKATELNDGVGLGLVPCKSLLL